MFPVRSPKVLFGAILIFLVAGLACSSSDDGPDTGEGAPGAPAAASASDEAGAGEATGVVFTSDHGMSIGEHGRTGKSNISPRDDRRWPIHPEVAHVPFMIAAPGLEGGRTVDLPMQPPDTLPTLLDLAGLEVTPPEPVHGVSMASVLRGESDEPVHDCAITAQYLRPAGGDRQPDNWTTPMLYTDRWAYAPLGAHGERELYDVSANPYAESDVASEHPEVVSRLHDRLLSWMRDVDAPSEAIAVFEA